MLLNLRPYRLVLMATVMLGGIILAGWLCWLENPAPDTRNTEAPQASPASFYGEFLDWEEADQQFPRYAKATVIDLETRLAFRVQRRAGDRHADVQPLTADDTEIMKTIYQGKWSWQRKAIVVELENGRRLAGSMHGMPHGAGAIRGNNFNGHFCIHFQNSTTHAGRRSDPAHQIMVWKAARQVDQQLKKLSPEEALRVFFTAVDQGETAVAARMLADDPASRLLLARTVRVDVLAADDIAKTAEQTYRVSLRFTFQDQKSEHRQTVRVRLARQKAPWIIEPEALLDCLSEE